MKHYINHVKSLYVRPTLNGVDGNMQLRAASPFELFLDLIFVIALSKLAHLFESHTLSGFIEATLLFMIVYSIWYSLTTYTVMFVTKEINYWTRAMIFFVMLPLIIFISTNDLSTNTSILIFCSSLATSKIVLAAIFKDSVVNAPINNIVMSTIHLSIARTQTISAIMLIIAPLFKSQIIFLIILSIIAIREVIYIPRAKSKILKKYNYPYIINRQLFMERQLLFIILIFGESLIAIANNVVELSSLMSIGKVSILFAIMYLFYVRISEETEYNSALINISDNLTYWMLVDFVIFTLFQTLSLLPNQFAIHASISTPTLILLIFIMFYIIIVHLKLDFRNLKLASSETDKLFHKVDIKMNYLMTLVTISLIFFHGSELIIYIHLLIFFTLHVLALPFRSHLIDKKCSFAQYVEHK